MMINEKQNFTPCLHSCNTDRIMPWDSVLMLLKQDSDPKFDQ